MLGLTIVAALAMERIAFRPARGADADTLLVTSFAVSFLLQNLAILFFGALPRSVAIWPFLTRSVDIGSYTIPNIDLVTVGVTVGLLAAFGLFLGAHAARRADARRGRELHDGAAARRARQHGDRRPPSRLSGLLAGVASIILVQQTGIMQPTIGVTPVLAAFVATILGGLGSLVGAVVGGYFLGALTVALQATLPLALPLATGTRSSSASSCSCSSLRPQGFLVHRSTYTRV